MEKRRCVNPGDALKRRLWRACFVKPRNGKSVAVYDYYNAPEARYNLFVHGVYVYRKSGLQSIYRQSGASRMEN